MKKFILNIFLFLLLIIVYTVILNTLFTKSLSGNDHNLRKTNYFNKYKNQYNTFFIGSSRTFRHINPLIFDSIVNANGLTINSFNFGTPATYYPECFYVLENLIQNNNHIKYVFLELQQVNDIGKVNLFASKTFYYLNTKYLSFITNYALNSNMNFLHKISFIGKYYIAYLYKLIAARYLLILQKDSSGDYVLGKNKNGFLSLNDHLLLTTAEYKEINNNRGKLLKDTTVLRKRAEISIRSFGSGNYNSNNYFNKYMINWVNKLNKLNVKLYFIIPPRLKSYEEFIALQKTEIGNRIINMADASLYPQFYQFKYSFDIGHLNKYGADVYTRILSNQFLSKEIND